MLPLLEAETNEAVLATMLVTAGLLGDAGLAGRLRSFLAASRQEVRWAAATALARLAGTGDRAAVGEQVFAELAAVQADIPEVGRPGIAFHDGDLRGYAAASLTLLADRHPAEALRAVTDGLAAAEGPATFALTTAALRMAFGPQRPAGLPPFAQLHDGQQHLIRVLAGRDQTTWQWANFVGIVRAWGLPHNRAALSDYAGMPTS